jgi:hypothetical protein
MEYDTLTDQINNAVLSSISAVTDWNAVPGGLDKVSSSALGFAWGMGNGRVWVCQLPCEGNWKQVEVPVTSSLRDIVTDDSQVYVLFQNQLAMKSADNVSEWITVDLPDGITKIISTASYIWGQAEDQKYKLPKPGVTGNWIPVKDDLNVKVTSASSGHLYGVDKDGKAMVTDESMQTSWSVIPEFGGKYTAIFGDADNTAIYGIDATNSLKRCLNGKCTTVDTKGYTPQNITIDPSSKQMWMTTTGSGKSGNIFKQTITTDYSDLLKTINPLDVQRAEAVKEVENNYKQATYSEIMGKQFAILKNMLASIFQFNPAASNEETQKIVQNSIDNTDYELNTIKNILPFVQKFLIVLTVTILVYALSDYLGSATHFVALAFLVAGFVFFAVNK